MPFKIAARTILHLGADLISSDAVALYELIKNSVDARSREGVDIEFQIVLPRSSYDELQAMLRHNSPKLKSVDQARAKILERLDVDARPELRDELVGRLLPAKSFTELALALDKAYDDLNHIRISDTGDGMSLEDLSRIYLTIGTTHRARITRKQLVDAHDTEEASYLGEKGIGRLSTMRLGNITEIETATTEDVCLNKLEIDWRRFEEADEKSFTSIDLEPFQGPEKPKGFTKGTTITIKSLKGNWNTRVLHQVIQTQIARLIDPFSPPKGQKRRFPIRFSFNGEALDYERTIFRALLQSAHGICTAKYRITDAGPSLTYDITVKDLDTVDEHGSYEVHPNSDTWEMIDLVSLDRFAHEEIPRVALTTVGDFEFELYWYNRRRLTGLPKIGDRNQVKALVEQWCGVLLFRDGYRVLPYGDEGDDWLSLDRSALGSGGYKLNTKQFIGRVKIGRLRNPALIDQTNRQGLRDCPEKSTLTTIVSEFILGPLKNLIDDVQLGHKRAHTAFAMSELDERMTEIEKRSKQVIGLIQSMEFEEHEVVLELEDIYVTMRDVYDRVTEKINLVEDERHRMIHLAGIGLAVELIAHELARAITDTRQTVRSIPRNELSSQATARMHSLSEQLEVVQKRLSILDRLSLPRRNRRSNVDLWRICSLVIDSHRAKLERHEVTCTITYQGDQVRHSIIAFAVEGLVIQILENLISNSIYWIDRHREIHPKYRGTISIELDDNPPSILFFDNGPGIPPPRREVVFEPYFSTKGTHGRHGLGLWIARENAEMMGGQLILVDEPAPRRGRLSSFLLTLVKERENEGG